MSLPILRQSRLRLTEAIWFGVPSAYTTHLPFFLANGGPSAIALTTDNQLPFYLADGTHAPIPTEV